MQKQQTSAYRQFFGIHQAWQLILKDQFCKYFRDLSKQQRTDLSSTLSFLCIFLLILSLIRILSLNLCFIIIFKYLAEMKKTNQHRSKEQLILLQQSQQVKPNKTPVRLSPRQLNNSSNLRFFTSHPFSQAQRQQFNFSRMYNRNYTNSRCQPKESSKLYKQSAQLQYISSQNILVLQQRLKNIRQYYETMINEEKIKNAERSQVIIELILEMQASHAQKMQIMKRTILESEEEKKNVGIVDQKMNEIKGNIDQLINQSNSLKAQNQQLQKQITLKLRLNEQKQVELQQLSQEVLEARTQLQQFQMLNLKNNKANKQIMEIFNAAQALASH